MVALEEQQALLGAGAAAGGSVPFFHATPVTQRLCPHHAAQSAALQAEHAKRAGGRAEEEKCELVALEQQRQCGRMWEVAAQYCCANVGA